jgi:hypothetical protein
MMSVQRRNQFQCIVFSLVVFGLVSNTKAADASAENGELKQIYDADQNDREAPLGKTLDWDKINPRDTARRKRVRVLIEQGRLNTGKDYERAAMVFQHGEGSDDILLAHVLAVTAIGKGDMDARWLAAATLDRFLTRVGQPQVFGTQFSYKMENGQQTWTMEPYNRTLIEPSLRDSNCVPDQKHQAETLEALSKGQEPQPPAMGPCVVPPKH